jgi:hypothetical protein
MSVDGDFFFLEYIQNFKYTETQSKYTQMSYMEKCLLDRRIRIGWLVTKYTLVLIHRWMRVRDSDFV